MGFVLISSSIRSPKEIGLTCFGRTRCGSGSRTSPEPPRGGASATYRSQGPVSVVRANSMVERNDLPLRERQFRSFRPRKAEPALTVGDGGIGPGPSPMAGAPLLTHRGAPPALRPDVGAWCSSTKVPASIPIRANGVEKPAAVARMTFGLSLWRQVVVRTSTKSRGTRRGRRAVRRGYSHQGPALGRPLMPR